MKPAGDLTIQQRGREIVLWTESPGVRSESTYRLDGSETTNAVLVEGKRLPKTSRAEWRGDTLVLRSTVVAPSGSHVLTERLSLDAHGRLLIEASNESRGKLVVSGRTTYNRRSPIVP